MAPDLLGGRMAPEPRRPDFLSPLWLIGTGRQVNLGCDGPGATRHNRCGVFAHSQVADAQCGRRGVLGDGSSASQVRGTRGKGSELANGRGFSNWRVI